MSNETEMQIETGEVDNNIKSDNIRLVDIKIDSEPIALNVMVQFLTLAHKRGVYSLEESAKIWECISMFIKKEM